MSRDGWKSKFKDLKATVKGDKNRLAHLTRSREQWRIRAERAGDQITTLEVGIAELRARLAAWGGVQENESPRRTPPRVGPVPGEGFRGQHITPATKIRTNPYSRFGPATAERGSRGIRDQPRNSPKYTEKRIRINFPFPCPSVLLTVKIFEACADFPDTIELPDPTGLQVLKKCRVFGRRHFCHPTSSRKGM